MLQCAFYETDITPPLGCDIPGYFTARPSTGVLDRLYAKAFIAHDGTKYAVLIEIDAVELPVKIRDAITARIQSMTGISPVQVAVCATHTHYGVPAGEPVGSAEDVPFMTELCRLAADCAVLAFQRLQPCTLHFGLGRVDGVSFNRDYLLANGRVCTNPEHIPVSDLVRHYAENDPDLPVLYAADTAGHPFGALIGFACHQDCVGGTQYSGDFSSVLSYRLKETYGSDFVSVYLAAPSGDINHLDFLTHTVMDYRKIGNALAAEASRVMNAASAALPTGQIQARLEPVTCRYRRASAQALAAAREIASGASSSSFTMLGQLQAELLLAYEEKLRSTGLTEGSLPVQVFLLGSFPIFIMPGELYHQFGQQLKQACGERCLIATLGNGFYGYLPILELFGTDVYPVQLCEGSMWQPEAGGMITSRAIAMLHEMLKESTPEKPH